MTALLICIIICLLVILYLNYSYNIKNLDSMCETDDLINYNILNNSDDDCKKNNINSINNNLIVQRRIRREIDGFKREKENIRNIIKNKKKDKKKLEIKEINECVEDEKKNIIHKCCLDIKIKLKNLRKNKIISKEILLKELKYANKLIDMISESDNLNKINNEVIDNINEYIFLLQRS